MKTGNDGCLRTSGSHTHLLPVDWRWGSPDRWLTDGWSCSRPSGRQEACINRSWRTSRKNSEWRKTFLHGNITILQNSRNSSLCAFLWDLLRRGPTDVALDWPVVFLYQYEHLIQKRTSSFYMNTIYRRGHHHFAWTLNTEEDTRLHWVTFIHLAKMAKTWVIYIFKWEDGEDERVTTTTTTTATTKFRLYFIMKEHFMNILYNKYLCYLNCTQIRTTYIHLHTH